MDKQQPKEQGMQQPKEEKRFYPFPEDASAEAIVIHCSDPRFQDAFHDFIKTELGILHPAPIIIPGSVSAISLGMAMPKQLKVLKDYVTFMAEHSNKPRLVVINHENCQMYASVANLLRKAVHHQQTDDLRTAMNLIAKWVPAVQQVELYMARIDTSTPKKRVFFEKII